jgi:hypothetical protein
VKDEKMRISKMIVALLVSVVALMAMTGVAVADPEYIEVLPDGSSGDPEGQTELGSPIIIDNTGGVTRVDLGFWGYKTISLADQKHVLNLTINPLSGGALANQITLNVIDDKGYNNLGVRIDWGLETPELQNVPEFATIAIPAIAVLGLFLFFNKRKQKKD